MLIGSSGGLHARCHMRTGGQLTTAYYTRPWLRIATCRRSVRPRAERQEGNQPMADGEAHHPSASNSSSSSSSKHGNTQNSSIQPPTAWQRVMDASAGSVCELGDWEGVTSRSVVHPGSSSEDIMRAEEYGNCRYECDADKGLIYGATVRFADSAALRLRRRAVVMWDEDIPRRVLIIKKPIPEAAQMLLEMAEWLQGKGVQVYVERAVHHAEFPQFLAFEPGSTQVDFGITLGGDGTVLYMSALFHEDTPLPPVLCFAMGTLGFLTPFDAREYKAHLSRVLAANSSPLFCTLRSRKRCELLDDSGALLKELHVLNECVIDRGSFPGAVYMEIYIDGGFVTAAEADGLIIATPSGSTAYSMSAGGSMVAPSVPCTLITPLSPHSLSFRPLVVPESSDILVRLPPSARSHARASFDGKSPCRVPRGSSIRFTSSLCPLPTINIAHLDFDWFSGINYKLKWNQSIRAQPAATLVGAPLSDVLPMGGAAAASGTRGASPMLVVGAQPGLAAAGSNGTRAAAAAAAAAGPGGLQPAPGHGNGRAVHPSVLVAAVAPAAPATQGQGHSGAASNAHDQDHDSEGSAASRRTPSVQHPGAVSQLAWGAGTGGGDAAAAAAGSGEDDVAGHAAAAAAAAAARAAQAADCPSVMSTDSSMEDMEFSMDGAEDHWHTEAAGVQLPSVDRSSPSSSLAAGSSSSSSSSNGSSGNGRGSNGNASSDSGSTGRMLSTTSSADMWFVPRQEDGAATPGSN